jgi:CRISPR type III-B/RAMP module-associated protein Cmr5
MTLTFQSRDQLRAADAYKAAKDLEKNDLNRLPGLILGDGLLPTLAFVIEKSESQEGMKKAMDRVAQYLFKEDICKPPATGRRDSEGLLEYLLSHDSLTLQHVTSEVLAYLAYLKRFAKKGKDETS